MVAVPAWVRWVQWERASGRGETKVHVDTPVLLAEHGRSGCGKRYLRDRAMLVLYDGSGIDEPRMCRSCLRALTGRGVQGRFEIPS